MDTWQNTAKANKNVENAAAKTTKQTTAPIHLNAWDAAKHMQHGTTHATNEMRRATDKGYEGKTTRDSI